jgi:dolichol-phosphate mannosyltransferase
MITVLLPTLNEEKAIEKVIDEIPVDTLRLKGYSVRVLVVDGKSHDRTRELAAKRGARVIIQEGRGKGKGVRQALSEIKTDYLFMLDADGTYPPKYIVDMLTYLDRGYDVVLGSRFDGEMEDGAMSTINYIGNRLLTTLANMLYGTRISDVCTGLWGFSKRALDNLHLNSNRFEIEAELFSTYVKANYRIAEIPIRYRRRPSPSKLSPLSALSIARKLVTRKFISIFT